MLAFSSARRAVACAQDIQHGIGRVFADTSPPIHVRIGVHTGDAVREADDFFGNAVNYAARVASQALGGEVLVSSLVRELVAGAGPGITFLDSRDVELKGLDGSTPDLRGGSQLGPTPRTSRLKLQSRVQPPGAWRPDSRAGLRSPE